MLRTSCLFDSPLREEHEIDVNGKVFRVEISQSKEGPVLAFQDDGIQLEPHEREFVIAELGQMSQDFRARRLWGSYTPINAKPWKRKTSR
jgi:hypothetical protein